ncbi:MAG TPA: polyprenyl synthetase family protein, partial [Thermosynergistes sp.]|nr:polyprenyl synthetase family protein [Thermosynergistes sp.]
MSKDSKNIDEIVIYIEDQIARHKALFDRHLEAVLAEEGLAPRRLREAMGYSLMAGGKRLRPTLCMTAAEVFGASAEMVLPMAVSFEMSHTASLIHDDLTCMDNDAMR